jgi:Bacterial extracellular solute-binding protein
MSDEPKLTLVGKLFLLLVLGACAAGAWWAFNRHSTIAPGSGGGTRTATSSSSVVPAATDAGGNGAPVPQANSSTSSGATGTVEIGVAYGTEKKRWLEWAAEEFPKTQAGRGIQVNLIPLGSIEAAQAITGGDKRIDAWSPAADLYTETFVREFELKHGRTPIAQQEQLALTPMVFVSWGERTRFFLDRYKEMSFKTVGEALKASGGWGGIAQKPDWGFYKFAHTHPSQSNSGLMALLLMAYDFHDKTRGLTMADILEPKFQSWMVDIESSVVEFPNSTGNLMKDMVLKGPSSFDCVLVYESVAIDYLKNAEGRWGTLQVTYPRRNLWSNNPYYVLSAPWSDLRRQAAATALMKFLISEPAQKMALTHGFRPGNPAVPILFPESPFTSGQKFGLKVDLNGICESPKGEVIHNLLVGWNNNVRSH